MKHGRSRHRGRDWLTALALLVSLGALALIVSRWSAEEITGHARVVDGDSLEIAANRLRLRGIDAPELAQTCRGEGGAVACGREARRHLVRLIGGLPATCTGHETDLYDRQLVVCHARGENLNAAMVRDGWALADGRYHAEQDAARRARRGLWALTFDRPEDWRRQNPRMDDFRDMPEGFEPRIMLYMLWLGVRDWFASWLPGSRNDHQP